MYLDIKKISLYAEVSIYKTKKNKIQTVVFTYSTSTVIYFETQAM